MKNDPTLFHFTFHKIFDLPEALTADRERLYLQHFYDEFGYKPTAVDADHFARAFNEPGAIRAGFAMHVHPGVPWGTVSVEAGPVNASSDNLRISIEGVGGHGAYPHLARDPILALSHAIVALQSLVSRRLDPMHAGVFGVGWTRAGSAENVIPASAGAGATPQVLEPGTARRCGRRRVA